MKVSRFLAIFGLSMAGVLFAVIPAGADVPTIGGPDVVLLDGSRLAWQEARRIIETHGGRIDHIVPPSALIGTIPEAAKDALLAPPETKAGDLAWSGDAIIIVRGRAAAERLISGELSFEARLGLEFLRPTIRRSPLEDGMHRLNPDGSTEVLPPWKWEEPARAPLDQMPGFVRPEGIGNTFYNTSDFMAGDVTVGILRPESNGAVDAKTETWTPTEITNTWNYLITATAKLQGNAPAGKLTFVYRTEQSGALAGTVASNYEAVAHPNFYDPLLLDVLGTLGYATGNSWNRMHLWVNDLRTTFSTDWAIGFFIADDSAAAGSGRSSAYMGGPCVYEWSHTTNEVYHHEMGHSFSATDEYHPDAAQSPTGLWGYAQNVNANSQYNDGTGYFGGAGEGIPALQIGNINYPSPWERGQWGIWDLDGDGIYELEDTFPTVTLNAPSGTGPLTFTGTANVTALPKETGTGADANISISKIVAVEWRQNGGPWQNATAVSPPFDASSEAFTFTTPSLTNGGYVIEARATEKFGNKTALPARSDSTITGSVVTNAAPMVALSVTPTLGSTATNLQFTAVGSVDAEDGTTLEYRWDWENDGTWDTAYSSTATASHTYGSAGTTTAAVMVKDSGGVTATRTVTFTVAAANVPPTATFIVDKGVLFVPGGTPVWFNFDASGVSDGEDATSALQVRWDFEDDGIWDTSYSTTKTASKNYASGYAVNPSNDITGMVVGGPPNWAQGFVAQSSGIGKAELNLRANSGATPGGNVTVGIKSSLAGAWLTSMTVTQNSLATGSWDLFDFSDIAVTNGNTYYLVAEATDADMGWEQTTTNPYAGGDAWYSFGGSYTNYAPNDLAFRIYDSTLGTVPLTKSRAWAVRMEVLDTNAQTAQTVRHVIGNSYDSYPHIDTASCTPCVGTIATSFGFGLTGSDPDSATSWDGYLNYRWDYDGDGNWETEFEATTSRSGVTYSRSGIYSMTMQARDRYMAINQWFRTVSVAPGLTALVLADRTDGSTTTTNELIVEARLTASALPEEAILSESSLFVGASWQPYRPVLAFTLSAGNGLKTVYAKTRSGVGNESAQVSATITYAGSGCTAPGAPTLDTATGTCSGVDSAWTAGTGTTNSYNVYRADACGGSYSKIAGPLVGLTYSDTSGVPGTSYGYVVRGACDAGGLDESPNSNCLTATRGAIPAAPAAPTFSGVACTAATLNWAAVPAAATYDVFRSPGAACATPAMITGSPIASTTYPDSGLTPDTLYSYFITANSACGTSANGTCASVTPTGPPGTPTDVFTETFDGPTAPALPADWATLQLIGPLAAWATNVGTRNPVGGGTHSGTNLAYFNSYDAQVGQQARLYRTSGVNLSTSTAASVSFWMYHESGYPAANDTVQASTSTDLGGSWVLQGAAVSRYAASSAWTQHTIVLAGVTGSADVRIAFLGTSAYGNDIHIDDVTISSTPGSSCDLLFKDGFQ